VSVARSVVLFLVAALICLAGTAVIMYAPRGS
jgi:hypothetical protein